MTIIARMSAMLVHIYRYPVKGMTAEALEHAPLSAGARLPGDRRFAIAHGGGMNLESQSDWQPKQSFLTLMRDERLALLEARLDWQTSVLTLYRAGKQVARGDLSTPLGRTLIEQFLGAFMKSELRGAAKLVDAKDGAFTDADSPWISIVNLASVRDLESRIVRAPVNPVRFRANLYIDGIEPWRELEWVGRQISVGPVRLRIKERIERCAATSVDPVSAARDLNIVRALQTGLGHCDMGLYAEVTQSGEITRGDAVTLLAE